MIILGIETSCDETALALVEADGATPEKATFKIIGNAINSQIKLHEQYGGVFPMIAKREHAKNLVPLFEKLLKDAGFYKKKEGILSDNLKAKIKEMLGKEHDLAETFISFLEKIEKPNINLITFTYGPGLEPTLWVGINFAKALSIAWNIPAIAVNHMEGHVFSALLGREKNPKHQETITKKENSNPDASVGTPTEASELPLKKIEFPALALLISGGHTELILIKNWLDYKIIGETKDDAVGEAFDKVARILGLPYPGGPRISALAEISRIEHGFNTDLHEKKQLRKSLFPLPRPMIHSNDYNFSFSGLKTAVLYTVKKIPELTDNIKQEIAFEFEESVTDVLLTKTKRAIDEFGIKTLLLGGGVVANKHIREAFNNLKNEHTDMAIYIPESDLTTDNALMIALAGYSNFIAKRKSTHGIDDIRATGNLKLS